MYVRLILQAGLAGGGLSRRPPFGVIILAAGLGGAAVLIKLSRSIEVPLSVGLSK